MHFYDPLYGRIEIERLFRPIINSSWFRRLQHLRQLGLCYLSFPGGNHTRFEHSLGSFHLASLVGRMVEGSSALSTKEEAKRLVSLLRLGALCHDIGHGPFSHMTENVLTGLGSHVSHEDVGAAIVTHHLRDALRPFETNGIFPMTIGQLITKSVSDDPLARCAMDLVSSDLDLDRLDYLHRDSHYSGQEVALFNPWSDLADIWSLTRYGNMIFFELTARGVSYAEKILFMRRNNYQRIVFDSDHMCVTAMYEKAVHIASQTDSEFGNRCNALMQVKMDWSDEGSVKSCFPAIWALYGLADYEALNLLERAYDSPSFQQLVRKIRTGHFYRSLHRFHWVDLHYLSKQLIFQLKDESAAFPFRRKLEVILAQECGVTDVALIAAHVPRFVIPGPLRLGTVEGTLLEDKSPLGRFLSEDVKYQYTIEVFVDDAVKTASRDKLVDVVNRIFLRGEVGRLKE